MCANYIETKMVVIYVLKIMVSRLYFVFESYVPKMSVVETSELRQQ